MHDRVPFLKSSHIFIIYMIRERERERVTIESIRRVTSPTIINITMKSTKVQTLGVPTHAYDISTDDVYVEDCTFTYVGLSRVPVPLTH